MHEAKDDLNQPAASQGQQPRLEDKRQSESIHKNLVHSRAGDRQRSQCSHGVINANTVITKKFKITLRYGVQ